MAFIPQSPGIVGFGGGNKPAVFQAVAPLYQLINQQFDEPTLPCSYTGDIEVAISGINICPDCFPGPPLDFKITAFTGINGGFTAAFSGGGWSVIIGTITLTRWVSVDGSCSGDIVDVNTFDVSLTIFCTGAADFQVQAGIAGILVFYSLPPQTIDIAIPNVLITCGEIVDTEVTGGTDGFVTLSLP